MGAVPVRLPKAYARFTQTLTPCGIRCRKPGNLPILLDNAPDQMACNTGREDAARVAVSKGPGDSFVYARIRYIRQMINTRVLVASRKETLSARTNARRP